MVLDSCCMGKSPEGVGDDVAHDGEAENKNDDSRQDIQQIPDSYISN